MDDIIDIFVESGGGESRGYMAFKIQGNDTEINAALGFDFNIVKNGVPAVVVARITSNIYHVLFRAAGIWRAMYSDIPASEIEIVVNEALKLVS